MHIYAAIQVTNIIFIASGWNVLVDRKVTMQAEPLQPSVC